MLRYIGKRNQEFNMEGRHLIAFLHIKHPFTMYALDYKLDTFQLPPSLPPSTL